ncbi:MAG: hypothetical protein OXL37_04485 [Chloroflexota bacterium]|nr:hypothetical protein [Chloroflexota bacterium]MDE2960968.1 hypothetical protein [Chloroflexota bacterium]
MKDFIVNQLCNSPPDNHCFWAEHYEVLLPVAVVVVAILVLTLAFKAVDHVVGKKRTAKNRGLAR